MTSLWPIGCTKIEEVPYELVAAIEHANMVMNWYENLPKKEVPPRWMWPFDDELEAWFERVDKERKAGSSSPSKSEDSPAAPMVQNELTKGMGRG